MGQMTQFGTTLIGVHPGKTETRGLPGMLGGSQRPLTLDDARALARLPGVVSIVPTAYGTGTIKHLDRGRRCYVYATHSEVPVAWSMPVENGEFIPAMEPDRPTPVPVLCPQPNPKLSATRTHSATSSASAKLPGRRHGAEGPVPRFDFDDVAFIPVANAMRLFNRRARRVDLRPPPTTTSARRRPDRLLKQRRRYEDVTIVTQKEGQAMMGRI
jgi:putative ABC transport system permease protein